MEAHASAPGRSWFFGKEGANGGIVCGSVEEEGGEIFTGYLVNLNQNETFTLVAGPSQVQLRIKKDGEVGSSKESTFDLGSVLSDKVIWV